MGMTIKQGNVYSVYCICLYGSDKVYVGITSNIVQRFSEHVRNCQTAKKNYMETGRFSCGASGAYKMYQQYALTNRHRYDIRFFIVADRLNFDEADAMETRLIKEYRSCEDEFGWNTKKSKPSFKVYYGAPPISARPERGREKDESI